MVNRLVSVGDDFTLPPTVKAADANLPARLSDTALSATYATGRTPAAPSGSNDLVALQAAIDTAAAAGTPLTLKKSFYLVSGTVKVPSNTVIEGNGATIQAMPGTNVSVLANSDAVNGNTGISIRNLKLDGNGANQTVQFTVATMTKVTHSRFQNLDVQGGLRNQMFPNGTYGEGFSLILSDHNEVIGGRFHHNAYDGLKLRSSNWNRISNVLCDDNGRSGIQISFFSPTGPPYNVGENVESAGSNDNVLENIIVRHSTGTPHSTAPTTSGIYFHTAARNIVKGFQIEGVQQGIGLYGTTSDNSLSDGLILHRFGSTARAGIDCENGTEYRNTFVNVKVRGMAGASGKLVQLVSGGMDNRFLGCTFEQAAGTGTWTIENAATGTQFLDTATALTITSTGTGAVIRDPKTASAADLGKPKRTDSFSGASGAVPFGWAARWNQTGATWTEDAGGYLRVVKTGSGRSSLANQLSGDGTNVEILAKVRTSAKTSGSTPIGVVARGSGATASENGYYLGLSTADSLSEIYIQRYAAGVSTGIGFSNAYTWPANTWVWVRFRVSASTAVVGAVALNAKIWADGAAEPADWQIAVADNAASKITTAGFHGAFAFSAGTSDVDTYTATILD